MNVLALEKVNYIDGETPITAKNLNEIQDEILAAKQAIEDLQTQGASTNIVPASVE